MKNIKDLGPEQKLLRAARRAGFTLIELLVVVLIIGILAVVAVPQYQKAVNKSKAAGWLALADSIQKAEEVYYMANGEYALDISLLDFTMPPQLETYAQNGLRLGQDAILDVTGASGKAQGGLFIVICPGVNTNWGACNAAGKVKAQFGINFAHHPTIPLRRSCTIFDPAWKGICSLVQ